MLDLFSCDDEDLCHWRLVFETSIGVFDLPIEDREHLSDGGIRLTVKVASIQEEEVNAESVSIINPQGEIEDGNNLSPSVRREDSLILSIEIAPN